LKPTPTNHRYRYFVEVGERADPLLTRTKFMGESERIYWDRASLIRANWPAYPNPTNYRYSVLR
jgi:hypothetical protein